MIKSYKGSLRDEVKLKAEVAEGNTPTVPYSDIKYLALEDTVNSMCEALMTA